MAQFRAGSMDKMASGGLRTKISDLRQWIERRSSGMATNDSNPSARNEQMTQHVAQVIDEIKEEISKTTVDRSDSKNAAENSKTVASQEEFTPIKAQDKRVFEVKARLLQDGYYEDAKYSSNKVLTGKLDDDMANAVKAFQEKNGLNATGVVDAQTYQAIMTIDLSQGGALDRNSEEAVALNSANYDSAADRLLAFANFYEGYYEKSDTKDLNSKDGSGTGNFTRFGRDYTIMTKGNGWGGDFSGSTWCQMFVDMMFVEAFGEEIAKKLLGGKFWSDCTHAAETMTNSTNFDKYDKDEIIDFTDDRFKSDEGSKNLKFLKTPQVGDLVYFKYGQTATQLSHVALVHSIEGAVLYTIEGNVGAKGDTDRVRIVKYKQVDDSFIGANYGKSIIVGFSRPDWSIAESVVNNVNDVESLKNYQDSGKN